MEKVVLEKELKDISDDRLVGSTASVPCVLSDQVDGATFNEETEVVEDISDINELINRIGDNVDKGSNLSSCSLLGPRDMFLAVLISNGMELDAAFLKAIHYDNPKMYIEKRRKVLNLCKKYVMERPALCSAIVELKDSVLQQYTERAKINKNVVMKELMNLKRLCMENPLTYSVALNSLKLIGMELGMFSKNSVNNMVESGIEGMEFGKKENSSNIIDINLSIEQRINKIDREVIEVEK